MITMIYFYDYLPLILPLQLLFNSWVIRKIHSNKDLEKRLLKKVVFGYNILHIIIGISIGAIITELFIVLLLLHLTIFTYVVLFFLMILSLMLLKQIIKTEKQFKRYCGHYSIKPPEGFYD